MPTAIAYRRAPLVDPAFVPLSDAAVHSAGRMEELTRRALGFVDLTRMTPLDSVLATKLGGYEQAPPVPDVEAAASRLPAEPASFLQTLHAAAMCATMSRDKRAMLRVLAAMRAFMDVMRQLSEEELFLTGADALRLTAELYRRTGQPFLLNIFENLRSQLPDVSGVMHVFPFQREFRPEQSAATGEEAEYHERMRRIATGKLTADCLSMTAMLAQYSGSGRDSAAARVGLAALTRHHGMPCGAFSADPYLAGRDPARAVELPALCAQVEALFDALCASGELAMAERLELILHNALPDMLLENGIRALQPTNRLADDDSCQLQKPEPEEISALLRALYALRRSVWLSKDDDSIAYLLPVAGGCLTRIGGVPIRFTAEVKGTDEREITIVTECAQPVACNLLIRIPGYADAASVCVNGGRELEAEQGQLFTVSRTFQNGDSVTVYVTSKPRVEAGHRGSVSIYFGPTLMTLALPNGRCAWRYAIVPKDGIAQAGEENDPRVLVTACEAPMWQEKAGFILPPPQGVPQGAAYELTLIPYAGTGGRIAAFPQA